MLYHGGSKEAIASPSRFLLPVQPCYEENMACSLKKERRNLITLFRKEFISFNKAKSFWGKEFGAF